jgi:nitrous oxidase accessory protein NosD
VVHTEQHLLSENNIWDNGEEGNYWDDYSGSDINGDGIGDTPYTIYENFTDLYPLTTPFDINSVNIEIPEWQSTSPTPSPFPQTEAFPTASVTITSSVLIIVISTGLMVYFKKRNENKTDKT